MHLLYKSATFHQNIGIGGIEDISFNNNSPFDDVFDFFSTLTGSFVPDWVTLLLGQDVTQYDVIRPFVIRMTNIIHTLTHIIDIKPSWRETLLAWHPITISGYLLFSSPIPSLNPLFPTNPQSPPQQVTKRGIWTVVDTIIKLYDHILCF